MSHKITLQKLQEVAVSVPEDGCATSHSLGLWVHAALRPACYNGHSRAAAGNASVRLNVQEKTTSKPPLILHLPGCHFSKMQLCQTRSRATWPLPPGYGRWEVLLFPSSCKEQLRSAPCQPPPTQMEKAARTPRRKRRQNTRESAQSQNPQPVSDGSPRPEVLQQNQAVTPPRGG